MSAPNAVPSTVPAAPQPARKRRWPWIVGGGLAILVVIGIVAPSSPTTSTLAAPSVGVMTTPGALGDISITQCTPNGPADMAQVTAQVHNGTDSTQSYMITVSLNDAAGNRVAEANGAANSIMPGQSARVELIGESAAGAVACTVASAVRIPV